MPAHTVLVTGGAGFVGAHTVKALSASGYDVVVYDSLTRGKRERLLWGAFEEGDIRDSDRLESVFERYQPQAVLHFAGLTYVDESVRDPAPYYAVNVEGLRNVAHIASQHDIRHFIFSSSCSVFGNGGDSPVDEQAPYAPMSPYARTKMQGEMLLDDFDKAYGMKVATLRYFNAAGADPDGEIGESDDMAKRVIPNLLKAHLREDQGQPFSIFGTDYDTRDGTALRDYVHVTDLAQAHVKALARLETGKPSFKVNLGSGQGTTIRELIAALSDITGHPVAFQENPRRPGDPAAAFALTTKAKELLGWTPAYNDIRTIIRHGLHWFEKSSL